MPHGSALPANIFRQLTRRRAVATVLLLTPLLILFVALFVYPLGNILVLSLWPGPSLDNYKAVFDRPLYVEVFVNSFKIAVEVAITSLAIGYPIAFALAYGSRHQRAILLFVILLPFWTSVLVRTYAWTVLLQSNGLINHVLIRLGIISEPLPLMFNEIGVVIGMTHVLAPFMIFPLYNALSAIDRNVIRAAQSLGAGPLRTFRRVILPLSLPGVTAGTLFVVVLGVGYYITPALLGGGKELMVANLIEYQVNELLNWGFAAALAICLLVVTLVIYLACQRVIPADRLWGAR